MKGRADRRRGALERLLAGELTDRSVREIHALQRALGEPLLNIITRAELAESMARAEKVMGPREVLTEVILSAKKPKKVRKPKRTTERKQVR